jgi:hypothetical protein
MRWMYDAAYPPENPPHWHVAAGYIGGDTPHVWTAEEWDAQWSPCRLPIFVHTGPDSSADAESDAQAILASLAKLEVPHGSSVAVDTESGIYQDYLTVLSERLWAERYSLINYGSLASVVQSAKTHGGRWAADWTGVIGMAPGDDVVATQWISAVQLGTAYDASVIDANVPLWQAPA